MNREIKFKLWDGRAKEWHTGRDFLLDLDGDVLFNNGYGGLSKCEYNCNDQIICQCTELKDKNGKEIYEGDIVKIQCKRGVEKAYKNYLENGLKVVRYGLEVGGDFPAAGFVFVNFNPTDLETGEQINCLNIQMCEIVGNIFETPKLLK